MPPAVAIGAAVVGSAGASILGANAQKKATSKTLKAQAAVNTENNALARENRDILTGYIKPYNEIGLAANDRINNLIGQGPYSPGISSGFTQNMNPGSFDDWKTNSGYDWNLVSGLKGVGTANWARGSLQSGAAVKDAIDYTTGLSSRAWGDYNAAKDRYYSYGDTWNSAERGYQTDQRNNYYNQVAGQQGVGLSAVNALAGVGNNYTSQVMGNNNQLAAAQSNAALAKGAANSNMFGGIANALGQAAGMYVYRPQSQGGWGVG